MASKEQSKSTAASRQRPAGKATRGPKKPKAALESELDDALQQTFPASDPIALESTLVPGGRR